MVMPVTVRMCVCMRMVMHVSMLMAVLVVMFTAVLVVMPMPVTVLMLVAMSATRRRFRFFFSVHSNLHMGSGNPAGLSPFRLKVYPWKSQTVHFLKKSFLVFQQFIERRHKHVSGRSHITLNI